MDICANRACSMGIIVIMKWIQIREYANTKSRLLIDQYGFLYGDALMAVTLILFILPTILYILSGTLSIVQSSYIDDYILQDTVSYIEAGKATYGFWRDANNRKYLIIEQTSFVYNNI